MPDPIARRDFLRAAAAPVASLAAHPARDPEVSCIFLLLVGGPSQLDTWDPKPDAPAHVRSPFRPIETNVAGIRITELFPRMARQADKFSLLRSMHHAAAPVHDVGHQAVQTGRVFRCGIEHPHLGCVVARLKGSRKGAPAHVVLGGPLGPTGGNLPHGQAAGYLGEACEPIFTTPEVCGIAAETERLRRRYGAHPFGRCCLAARRLVEAGVRFVTVNMFDTVFGCRTWDCHGYEPFSNLEDYRNHVAPVFDLAFSALLEDLHQRGLLSTTMVIATGEFGRTPRRNFAGGRDHWPSCWTALAGGGPLRCGELIGASDAEGAFPKDRPVTPAELAATIYHAFGIDPHRLIPGPPGEPVPLVDPGVEPIAELLA
jgi:hypothetical protein